MILFPCLACFHVFIACNDIQTRMEITLRKIYASVTETADVKGLEKKNKAHLGIKRDIRIEWEDFHFRRFGI